jgi:hypothetical protein
MCFINVRERSDITSFFSLDKLITGKFHDDHDEDKSSPIDSFGCLPICLFIFADKVKGSRSMHQ